MITPHVFQKYFLILTERFNRNFSEPTIAEYYSALSGLSDEEFTFAARRIFRDGSAFPSVKELIDLGHVYRRQNELLALPEAEIDTNDPAWQAERKKFFEKIKGLSLGMNMNSEGQRLSEIDPAANLKTQNEQDYAA
ncbi:hypothetical protein NIES2135_53990 [Leptolyngbya boryana NIES-2135]|jgi:hypothetical protein|uniref:Uncharacterized protein n=1 Tax=Leptolyngbya boryana NIES-2135 TaxID=1973484 RepID=A0A1Z4JP81_LEPBY|nr:MULTISPECIES: hypothetical protein [Leptolyngbya]BAY58526.1 hypothetical protein NIES2135_53990 [Leptolyngbya boryana NIES-2135]MBD2370792.1 hypothetical protein [Leptolyngbya sp. FACHB-161]MBD2377055.1 hypothetical protein [Leptolyngbya sp. FACHB-238]MBD2401498.1 hypothetical protein [Leptolyngbya sp. FACHB-239]MBD2408050.1 hypothetical protein [Leptolyngbya sp. FACHB-402]